MKTSMTAVPMPLGDGETPKYTMQGPIKLLVGPVEGDLEEIGEIRGLDMPIDDRTDSTIGAFAVLGRFKPQPDALQQLIEQSASLSFMASALLELQKRGWDGLARSSAQEEVERAIRKAKETGQETTTWTTSEQIYRRLRNPYAGCTLRGCQARSYIERYRSSQNGKIRLQYRSRLP
jgi:hypothetical protein